jgi:lipoate-protein ligase A
MASDEALLDACAAGAAGFPCLRLYAFAPAALSLGFSQPIAGAADLAFCRRERIDVVRRPTGGRAVLHDAEVTYAVIARRDEAPFAGSVLDSYHLIARGLMAGFARLGIETSIGAGGRGAPPDPARWPARPRRGAAARCYSTGRSRSGSIPIVSRGRRARAHPIFPS